MKSYLQLGEPKIVLPSGSLMILHEPFRTRLRRSGPGIILKIALEILIE